MLFGGFFCGTLHVSHLTCCRWGKKVEHMVAIYNLISLTDSSVVFNTSCSTNVASFKEEKASELFSKIKFHSWEFLFREISTRIRICSDCCSWMFSKSLEQTTIPKPEQIQTLQSVSQLPLNYGYVTWMLLKLFQSPIFYTFITECVIKQKAMVALFLDPLVWTTTCRIPHKNKQMIRASI